MQPPFESAFNLTKPSIALLQRNLRTFVMAILWPLLGSIVGAIVLFIASALNSGKAGYSGGSLAIFIIGLIILGLSVIASIINGPAVVVTFVASARDETIVYKDALKKGLSFFWRLVRMSICVGALVVVGLILLIVPGIFLAQRYLLAPYFMVDKNLGVFEAMRECRAASKQYGKPVWGLFGVQVIIQIIAIIPFIGGLISFVWSILYSGAPAYRYFEIKKALAGADYPPQTTTDTNNSESDDASDDTSNNIPANPAV